MFLNNIKEVYGDNTARSEKGEIASNMIFMVVMAIAAVAVAGWIGTSLVNKGADVASCIEGSGDGGNCDDQTKDSTRDTKRTNTVGRIG